MIAVCGDWHEAYGDGMDAVEPYVSGYGATVIQVGDFGWWPDATIPEFPFPVYFIEGNHDHIPSLLSLEEPTEVHPNLIYVPRGTILTIDGLRVAFLGGGDTYYQKEYRTPGVDWWPEEQVRAADIARFEGKEADVLISHEPPASVVREMLRRTSTSPTSQRVEEAWELLGRPHVICGHLHRLYRSGRVTVLPEFGVEPIGAAHPARGVS